MTERSEECPQERAYKPRKLNVCPMHTSNQNPTVENEKKNERKKNVYLNIFSNFGLLSELSLNSFHDVYARGMKMLSLASKCIDYDYALKDGSALSGSLVETIRRPTACRPAVIHT